MHARILRHTFFQVPSALAMPFIYLHKTALLFSFRCQPKRVFDALCVTFTHQSGVVLELEPFAALAFFLFILGLILEQHFVFKVVWPELLLP